MSSRSATCDDDEGKARYFGGLSIFMFSMIGIVLADNLFMMFMFWELVGFSSWLAHQPLVREAGRGRRGKKAFIVNRVGDVGFLLGIILCYWRNGTVNLGELGSRLNGGGPYSSRRSRSCSSAARSASRPSFPSRSGSPTPWRAPRRSRR
jgi:NADH-quinone oxidoreductase subunit L